MIWRYLLEDKPRFLEVFLESSGEQTINRRCYPSAYPSAYPDNTELCCPVIKSAYQIPCVLLQVNTESRKAALSFYRVRIPCSIWKMGSKVSSRISGIIYFNPEYDVLSVRLRSQDTLPEFLYRLKTIYDPRHVGLLHLALGPECYRKPDRFADSMISALPPDMRVAVAEVLGQLHEVFFIFSERLENHYSRNRSLPVMATVPNFERFPRDLRGISQDLQNMLYVYDLSSRFLLRTWLQRLEEKGMSPARAQYRLLLAYEPLVRILDREGAERWVREKDDSPTTGSIADRDQNEVPCSRRLARHEDPDYVNSRAFGFWLFPLKEIDLPADKWFRSMRYVYSREPLPELCLFNLP